MDLGERWASETRKKPRLQDVLMNRELGSRNPNANVIGDRQVYRCVYPNDAGYNVSTPSCVLRKFTPDGKYLICFTRNQRGIHVYTFEGPILKENFSRSNNGKRKVHEGDAVDETSHRSIFSQFFKLKYEQYITSPTEDSELLCKDFCLVTTDGKHAIFASALPSDTTPEEAQKYPCSLSSINLLEDVTFYIVDIESGTVTDKRIFKGDHIYLPHHAGVGLYGPLFAVLSVQHQSIHIMEIKSTGRFVNIRTIGWHNYEDDELALAQFSEYSTKFQASMVSAFQADPLSVVPDLSTASNGSYIRALSKDNSSEEALERHFSHPYGLVPLTTALPEVSPLEDPETATLPLRSTRQSFTSHGLPNQAPHSGVKQRLLAYLCRKARAAFCYDGGASLCHFHRTFHQYASMVMSRMQFLDADTIMIKFGNEVALTSRQSEMTSASVFFLVYSIKTTEVLGFYENTGPDLLALFERSADTLRHGGNGWEVGKRSFGGFLGGTNCSNNIHVWESLKKMQHTVRSAKYGGPSQATKRVLSHLPCSPQSFSSSPYFDHSLFSYDEKVLNSSDRWKPVQDFPIKFYDRQTGQVVFRLMPGPSPGINMNGTDNPVRSDTGGTILSAVDLANPVTGETWANNTVTESSIGGTSSVRNKKKYLQCISHPFLPFMIMVQHTPSMASTVNLHFYTAK